MEFSMKINWPTELDEKAFVASYWQQKPLLLSRCFPEFENPLSPDELAGLATEEEVSSRIIVKGSTGEWICHTGPFEEEELQNLPTKDWSMLVTDVEKALPEFRAYLEPFNFIPSWRIDDLMISYAPKGASVGAHIDNYDVFLFQAAGRREWSITEEGAVDTTHIPDQDIRVLANFQPDRTWVLEPGDVLYLPPGVPHHGVSLDNECMTWSIGFRAPTHRDIVRELSTGLAERISEQVFYEDPGFSFQEHRGEISPEAIRRIRAIWDSYLRPSDAVFSQLVGEMLTKGQEDHRVVSDPVEISEPEPKIAENLRGMDDRAYEIDPNSRLSFIHFDEGAQLFFNGKTGDCSIELAVFLTENFLFEGAQLLTHLTDERDRGLVFQLVEDGIIQELDAD